MKSSARFRYATLPLLLVWGLSACAAWVLCRYWDWGEWPSQLVPLTLCAIGSLVLIARHSSVVERERRSLQRYIDTICQVDAEAPERPLDIPAQAPAASILQQFSNTISAMRQKLSDAEQSRARAEVRARNCQIEFEQSQAILAGLDEPVMAINHFDDLVMCNSAAEQLFSISLANAESRALDRLIECETLVSLLTETCRRRAPAHRTGEATIINREGLERSYRISCRGLRTESYTGQSPYHGAVAVLTDISSEKVMQKRNAEFVSAVSHEMRAPLSGIRAYVELLADGDAKDDAEREEFLNVITAQTERLQRLVDNLLNLARIEAGVVDVRKKIQSLNELLAEAVGVVTPSAQQKQLLLVSDLSPLYMGVHCDRDMLMQAAINLLSNAIKYTQQGGKVTLRSRGDGPELYFEVEDSGVGLAPEDCERIFEKFYRAKRGEDMASGTGLGLPLAKHIVEDVHGGRLTVKSELGKGSIFRVTLANAGKSQI